MNPYEIVKRPVVSEKTMYLQNKQNAFTFEVHPSANKTQIREAVEKLFKVKVTSVNTMSCLGKSKRMRTRLPGMTAGWKKAIVRLVEGQKIEGI
jgi:large subunit ribosomal protein L23